MKKTILTLVLVFTAFTALAAMAAPTVQADGHATDVKSRIYYYVHTYGYRTYYTAPVVYYPRVYVAPIYPVYPVYTYSYWYYRFANVRK
jgi:hypothetical protein